MNKYSQLKAMLAITKASLRALLRNPSAVVFNLIFPLIFIVVFGFISGGSFRIDIALEEGSDMNNPVIENLEKLVLLRLSKVNLILEMLSELEKGRVDAIIGLEKTRMVL
ncbi:MAG: hypothetical protein R2942_09455 [Ignavibacteria bacterium]